MSSSLGLVRSIDAAWERNDFSSTDWADPAIEFVLTGGAPGDFSARGIAAMERGWGGFLRQWADLRVDGRGEDLSRTEWLVGLSLRFGGGLEDITVTVREVVPAGPGRLIAEIHVTASARGSGVPIDESGFAVWEFRGGKALCGRTYSNRHEALKAVGLEE